MFLFDVETLGISSESVVLSAAITHLKNNEFDVTYQDLLNRTCFVKFDIREQIKMGRTKDDDTVDFWKRQSEDVKRISLIPKETDLKALDGINRLKTYIANNKENNKEIFWARGSLDQMVIDSLCLDLGVERIAHFSAWRDVRTFIDIMYGSSDGYVDVEGLDKSIVMKHNPIHDCVYDILMMIKGIPKE